MTIEELQSIVERRKDVSGYTITSRKSHADELFLIRHSIDMVRAKDVERIELTVYKKYRGKLLGRTAIAVHPTMTASDIDKRLDESLYATQFAKNPFYPLPKKKAYKKNSAISRIGSMAPVAALKEIAEAVIAGDCVKGGFVNSAEIFLCRNEYRIVNSNGIDYAYDICRADLEFIATFAGMKEEIELYKFCSLASINAKEISGVVRRTLIEARDRAQAASMPDLGNFDVIVRDESAAKVLSVFKAVTNAQRVYLNQTPYKVGDNLQEKNRGDLLSMRLAPNVSGSTISRPIDLNGVVLKRHEVIRDGVILKNHGDIAFSHYLGIPVTGSIPNAVFSRGGESIRFYREKPHVEVVSFSALHLDVMTGSFGGEVRLAYYYDGARKVPVYGGTVMGNIYGSLSDLRLSRECVSLEGYHGPKYLIVRMTVAK